MYLSKNIYLSFTYFHIPSHKGRERVYVVLVCRTWEVSNIPGYKGVKVLSEKCHLVSVVGNAVQGLLGSNISQILSPLSSTVQAVCKPAPVCNTNNNSRPLAAWVEFMNSRQDKEFTEKNAFFGWYFAYFRGFSGKILPFGGSFWSRT